MPESDQNTSPGTTTTLARASKPVLTLNTTSKSSSSVTQSLNIASAIIDPSLSRTPLTMSTPSRRNSLAGRRLSAGGSAVPRRSSRLSNGSFSPLLNFNETFQDQSFFDGEKIYDLAGEPDMFANKFGDQFDPFMGQQTGQLLGEVGDNIDPALLNMTLQPRVSIPRDTLTYSAPQPSHFHEPLLNGLDQQGQYPYDPLWGYEPNLGAPLDMNETAPGQGVGVDCSNPDLGGCAQGSSALFYPKPEQGSYCYPAEVSLTRRRKRSYMESSSPYLGSTNSHYSPPSRQSSMTDFSDRGRSNAKRMKRGSAYQQPYTREKPKARKDKSWIRTNATTRGLTTRTGKINQYRPDAYEDHPHPLQGGWVSLQGNHFSYIGNVELSEPTYSVEQIRDFIFNYPKNKQLLTRLTLWIQKTPTDSAARYVSGDHSKCRFKNCPAQRYENGTIRHGHYRVAFDERHYAYGNTVDPFHCSAFVHLYCMERFLDFEAICRLGIVKVDSRRLPHEPKGRFAGTLDAQPEFGIAEDFVYAASHGNLRRNVEEFADYPVHSEYKRGAQKPFEERFLTYWMHYYKDQTRPPAQIKQFKDRVLQNRHLYVNKGDLERAFSDNPKAKRAARKAAGKKRKARDESDEDSETDAIVVKARIEAEQKLKGARTRASSREKRRNKKRKVQEDSDEESGTELDLGSDSDSGLDVPSSPRKGSRKSTRLSSKDRKRYQIDSPPPVHPCDDNQQPAALPQQLDYSNQQSLDSYYPAQMTDPMLSQNDFPSHTTDQYGIPIWTAEMDAAICDAMALQRRQSNFAVPVPRRSSRITSSAFRSPHSPRGSFSSRSDRRVSMGGVATRTFDTTQSPYEGIRRSSLRLSRIQTALADPEKSWS